MSKPRSILDHWQIKEVGFPLPASVQSNINPTLCVVGACPTCGSPIYGPRVISQDSGDVIVKRSCACPEKPKSLSDFTHTK